MIEGMMLAREIQVGWLLKDRSLAGTHGQRIEVQWVNHYAARERTYVAGVEESSKAPVQLVFPFGKEVQVWFEE